MNTESDNYPILMQGQVVALGRVYPKGDMRLLKHPYRLRHFYYPISDIKEEIYKRTSVIGSKRKTVDAGGNEVKPQLIDYYSLSADEQKSFDNLCRTASAKTFDVLIGHTDRRIDSYLYDENGKTLVKKENNDKVITVTNVSATHRRESNLTYKVVLLRFEGTDSEENALLNYLVNSRGFSYDNAYERLQRLEAEEQTLTVVEDTEYNDANIIKAELVNLNVGITEDDVMLGSGTHSGNYQHYIDLTVDWTTDKPIESNDKFVFELYTAYSVKNYMGSKEMREFKVTVEFPYSSATDTFNNTFSIPINIDESAPVMPGYFAEQFEYIIKYSVLDSRIIDITPAVYPAQSYVEYIKLDGTSQLYQTMVQTDSNADFNNAHIFNRVEADFRGSVHYILKRPMYETGNSDNTLDNAIFESLVTYVLWNWLQIIEPNNADTEAYKAMYLDAMLDVKVRLNTSNSFRHLSYPY